MIKINPQRGVVQAQESIISRIQILAGTVNKYLHEYVTCVAAVQDPRSASPPPSSALNTHRTHYSLASSFKMPARRTPLAPLSKKTSPSESPAMLETRARVRRPNWIHLPLLVEARIISVREFRRQISNPEQKVLPMLPSDPSLRQSIFDAQQTLTNHWPSIFSSHGNSSAPLLHPGIHQSTRDISQALVSQLLGDILGNPSVDKFLRNMPSEDVPLYTDLFTHSSMPESAPIATTTTPEVENAKQQSSAPASSPSTSEVSALTLSPSSVEAFVPLGAFVLREAVTQLVEEAQLGEYNVTDPPKQVITQGFQIEDHATNHT